MKVVKEVQQPSLEIHRIDFARRTVELAVHDMEQKGDEVKVVVARYAKQSCPKLNTVTKLWKGTHVASNS
jgi:hypothetical protein